jgi:hypothetical protein
MSRVVSLDRRLREVERRALVGPFDRMSDAQLEARYAEACAELAEHGGLPDGFDAMTLSQQQGWLEAEIGQVTA